METIRILSLPEIAFAHEYGDTIYRNDLPAKTNCIEVTYIAEGTLTLSRENTESTARRNDMLCNLFRAPLRVTGDTPHKHRTVCFFVEFADAEKDENGALSLPLVTEAAKTGKIRALIDEIICTHTLYGESRCILSGLFLQILGEIHACAVRGGRGAAYGNLRYVERAKEYVFENLCKPVKERETAQFLGISPEYFCAVFKNTEGIPFQKFVNRVKLEKIRSLMEKEKMPLCKAAEFLGYSDPNYVSRLYKKYFQRNLTDHLK